MIGLFLSELILFAVAGLTGFGLGWRLHALAAARRGADSARELDTMRVALNDAQVRRARIS